MLPNKEEDNEQNIKKVKLPLLGNETETKEISLDQIQPILHARIEEILSLIHDRLIEGGVIDNIDGGVILTGGMTLIPGVKELASLIFTTLPVKISNPKNIQNGYVDFNDPTMSTIVGLLLYELSSTDSFELDSNGEIKTKTTVNLKRDTTLEDAIHNKPKIELSNQVTNDISEIGAIKEKQEQQDEEKPKLINSLFSKISRWI